MNDRAVVRIDEVDVPNRTAHVVDKTGSTFKVGFWMMDMVFQIPAQNERWLITKQGHQWHLEKRWDRPAEAAVLDALSPGDVRLRVPGHAYVNEHVFGATRHEQFTS